MIQLKNENQKNVPVYGEYTPGKHAHQTDANSNTVSQNEHRDIKKVTHYGKYMYI